MVHFFVGEKAYTEDGFLILNLKVVDNGPTEDVFQQIANLFTKIGANKVRRIEDGVKRWDPTEDSCYGSVEEYMIEFVCPRAAAKALQTEFYKVGRLKFRLSACFSWDQPDGQKVIQQLNNYLDMNVVESNNIAPILTLNDDCLEHICKLLPLPDQIDFALSCQRFCTILASLSRIHTNNFHLAILERLTLFQARVYLQIVGPEVKSLTVASCAERRVIVSLLPMFLINVEKLKVHQKYVTNFSSFGKNMHSLKELELVDVRCGDEFIETLEELENLKSLTIAYNSDITGSVVAKLTGLEKLVLNQCYKMNTVDYEHIAKYLVHLKFLKIVIILDNCNCFTELPNLKVLEVTFLRSQTEKFFIALAEHQKNQLQELKINYFNFSVDDAVAVSKLKNLKVLKCDMYINDDIIEQFSNLKGLENIELYRITKLTDDGILNLLKCCLKLKRVLLWCYMDEKENLLIKLRKLLKQQIDQGERNSGVELVFLKNEDRSIPFELADVLKVTENLERVYDDDYDADYDDCDYSEGYDYDCDDYNFIGYYFHSSSSDES